MEGTWAQEPGEWQEDLAFYRSEILEPDPSFSESELQQANELLSYLETHLTEMSRASIELLLAEISALADNGHSFLMPGGWTERFNQLPLKFGVFSDGVFVTLAEQEFAEFQGYRLIAIDGHDTELLIAAWSRYQGGLIGWRNQYFPHFIESPQILHAAGLADVPGQVVLTLENGTEEPHDYLFQARTDLPPLTGMSAFLAPSQLLQVAVHPGPEKELLPLYLVKPDTGFRYVDLPELNAVYLQFKSNANFNENDDIEGFVEQTETKLKAAKPDYIILDQRFNNGGDLNVTRGLMQKLPEFVAQGGRVFVIVSGRTFSAGISSTAYLEQVAPESVIIVGEPVGDRLEFWAEGDLKILPHSEIAFLTATERHNYMTGCPEDDCHRAIQINAIKVSSIDPDYLTPLSHAEFVSNNDPAMEKIVQLINQTP